MNRTCEIGIDKHRIGRCFWPGFVKRLLRTLYAGVPVRLRCCTVAAHPPLTPSRLFAPFSTTRIHTPISAQHSGRKQGRVSLFFLFIFPEFFFRQSAVCFAWRISWATRSATWPPCGTCLRYDMTTSRSSPMTLWLLISMISSPSRSRPSTSAADPGTSCETKMPSTNLLSPVGSVTRLHAARPMPSPLEPLISSMVST